MKNLNLEVVVNGVQKFDLNKELNIDDTNLNQAYIDQPAKFAYWAVVAAQARSLLETKKLEIQKQEEYVKKTLIGELDVKVRKQMLMDDEKITESKVANAINIHPKYQEGMEELFELKEEYNNIQKELLVLEATKEAFNHRKDMLISLGANIRAEQNNQQLSK